MLLIGKTKKVLKAETRLKHKKYHKIKLYNKQTGK